MISFSSLVHLQFGMQLIPSPSSLRTYFNLTYLRRVGQVQIIVIKISSKLFCRCNVAPNDVLRISFRNLRLGLYGTINRHISNFVSTEFHSLILRWLSLRFRYDYNDYTTQLICIIRCVFVRSQRLLRCFERRLMTWRSLFFAFQLCSIRGFLQ